jgi:serine phosphatase RsbU (regulator of sigma subunit)
LSQKKSKTLVAAADCTGHGVPGALMSILGMAFLNEIASNNAFNRASDVLNFLREKIMKALRQTGDNEEPKDGMDLAFCIIDKENKTIDYAGANNPLYIIRNNELMEFKADRMPIGINAIEEKSFTNHKIKYFPEDILYLFSDGFVDQFGGPQDKKFKYGPFKNLLLEIHSLPMDDQKNKIQETFKNWKGDLEQIDDVLIIGLKP